ncbi:hypothetical protein CMO93_04750 [Candidatus Woesearchaeota archaeon]|jgi:hypothetical protein|nr:hypothetical protein [Candidatus Woesearchaeota archaeon]|tara:strand:- start:3917 stop:4477 length:561 start_codon:yes stop_codon:yes gene_type:complete
MLNNKRASLELSIRAIVIVVLAMTLLGLGLGFIKSQFSQITSVGTEVQQQVREQITGQLRTSGEKISFPREVQLSRGERKTLTVGVQNTGSETIWFGLSVVMDTENSDHVGGISEVYDPRYPSDRCSFSLSPADASAYGVNIKAPKTAGTDMLIVKVLQSAVTPDGGCADSEEGTYASKTVFITVG